MNTLLRERTCVCPNCSTEWLQHSDGTWENDAFFGKRWFDAYRGEPLPAGQAFCPACAESSADAVDRMGFIKAECREADFLEWLLKDAAQEDIRDIFSTLAAHAPELMETRMEEFVFDQAKDDFTEWRCGA